MNRFFPQKPTECPTRFFFLISIIFALVTQLAPRQTGAEASRKEVAPNMVLGISTGFVDHFGKSSEIDALSGATLQLEDKKINKPGGAAGVYADFGFVRLGPGDLGLSMGFWTSFPDLYFDIGIIPRYRFLFDTKIAAFPRVEPWLGIPVFFTFQDKFSQDFFLMLGGSLGCDFALGKSNFVLGLSLHINAVNPVPVKEKVALHGQTHKLEHRLDAVFTVVNLGYRVF